MAQRGRPPKKKRDDFTLATNEQLAGWGKEVAMLERQIDGTDYQRSIDRDVYTLSSKIQDPQLIRREIAKKKAMIERYSPKKMRPGDANAAYKRAKELKEMIQEAMPTAKAYFQPQPGKNTQHHRAVDFEKTVRQQMAFQQPAIQRIVAEYKYLMGRIDPGNPTVRNIELLRKQDRRAR